MKPSLLLRSQQQICFRWIPWVVHGKGNDTSVHGVAIDIYEAMRQKRIFDYQILREKVYGGALLNKKWTGLIGAMLNNTADIGGPLFVSEERSKVVKFAVPVAYSKLAILSGLVPANKNPYLIFGIFPIKVWVAILASVFLVTGTACLIYSILPSRHSKKKLEAFLRFIWIFQTSLLGQEFGANSRRFLQHIWEVPSFKLLQGLWILSCLVLTYSYQGSIISTYAADKMKPKYETLDDIIRDPRVKFGTFEKSYPLVCLAKLANTDLDDIWTRIQQNLVKPVGGVPLWLDSIEEGKAAYLLDVVHSKYMIGERFKKTGKCGIRVTPVEICASSAAFAIRQEVPQYIVGKFNDAIMRFNEGALTMRYLTETILFYDICTHSGISTIQPLGLSDLLGAFTVLGTGLAISVFYFVIEMVARRNRMRRTI